MLRIELNKYQKLKLDSILEGLKFQTFFLYSFCDNLIFAYSPSEHRIGSFINLPGKSVWYILITRRDCI